MVQVRWQRVGVSPSSHGDVSIRHFTEREWVTHVPRLDRAPDVLASLLDFGRIVYRSDTTSNPSLGVAKGEGIGRDVNCGDYNDLRGRHPNLLTYGGQMASTVRPKFERCQKF
jgi:hypothetical protein